MSIPDISQSLSKNRSGGFSSSMNSR